MNRVLTFKTLTEFGIRKLQQKKVVIFAVICMMVVFYLATFFNIKTDIKGKSTGSSRSSRELLCDQRSSRFNSSLVRKDWDYKLFVGCLPFYFYFIYILAYIYIFDNSRHLLDEIFAWHCFIRCIIALFIKLIVEADIKPFSCTIIILIVKHAT